MGNACCSNETKEDAGGFTFTQGERK
jgi:hypothetical protein